MEGRGDDLEIGNLESPLGGEELFAHREDRVPWMGAALPAGIHLALRSVALLVQALLA